MSEIILKNQIGYKGFDVDSNGNLYCQPNGTHTRVYYRLNEITTVDGELKLCNNGIHFCWNINDVHSYYSILDKIICKIEILGDVVNQQDMKKSCTNKIKVVEILTKEQVLSISNSGRDNSGISNSGDRNSGDYNSGNRNSGNYNSGDYNSGDYNSGNRNSGHRNSGDCNSGNRNSGHRNSGDYNSGNRNSGHCNSGHCNSGNRNSGHCNSGHCNSGDYNSGLFNTNSPSVRLFNNISEMTFDQFYQSKYWKAITNATLLINEWIGYTQEEKENDKAKELIGGYLKRYSYKEACARWWSELSEEDHEVIKSIPNFDANIFEEITGIKLT